MAPRLASQLDVGLNLALAVIDSSKEPLLLLAGDLSVVAASKSFCSAFEIDPLHIVGLPLREFGHGEWAAPQLMSLLYAAAAGEAEVDGYEFDLQRNGQSNRRLVLNAHKLDYGTGESVRLLVALGDVTDARAAEKLKDEMLKEKAVLLQELHHRVANSLQIIASVLMQSARNISSAETRGHLNDASHRIMSVSALQQQLASSAVGDVALKPYFISLCDSIGSSMIADRDKVSIDVDVDESTINADTSISLGLIVTELVINALKHAFPRNPNGKIKVDYKSRGPNWTLTVTDNGIGIPADPAATKAGLGTSIVSALTRQANATLKVSDAKPGTTVTITHVQISAVPAERNVATQRAV
jgi:two-component sensor histidine kinase